MSIQDAPARPMRLALGLAVLLSVAGWAGYARPAGAAVSFGVAPARVELVADPGAAGTQTLTVTNGGDGPVEVTARVEPYKGAAGEWSAVDWLAVEPAAFTIEPGAEQAVEVALEVPAGLDAGGRYAAVTFTTGASTAGGSGAAMAGQIGVPFLIAVEGGGDLVRRARLARFAPTLSWDGRVGFAALVRNEGNLHLLPAGEVAVGPVAGEPLGRLALAPTTALLPGSETVLPAEGTLPLDRAATFRATVSVAYGEGEAAVAAVEFAPEAALAIAGIGACENLDRGPTARLSLRNDGQLGLQPLALVTVRDANGGVLGTVAAAAPSLLWPGETAEVAIDLPERLVSGEYALVFRVDYAPPAPDGTTFLSPIEQETAIQVGGLGGAAIPLC
jgi:hypothetical protein